MNIMSKYNSREIISQKLLLKDKYYDYYDNVLISLGLSKFYILYNNYFYFGIKEISNQNIIKTKFENIEKEYNSFLNKIFNKYSCETLILELGIIYTKLQKIYLKNDKILEYDIENSDTIKSIAYPAKLADLMSRKIQNFTFFQTL